MTLKEFLSNEVKIGEIVVIREAGYQVGMTRVGNEKLFIRSLSEPKTVLYGEAGLCRILLMILNRRSI